MNTVSSIRGAARSFCWPGAQVASEAVGAEQPVLQERPSTSDALDSGYWPRAIKSIYSVLNQRQCVSESQALQQCYASSDDDAEDKRTKCREYVQALQLCGMQTQRNNYPVNISYMT